MKAQETDDAELLALAALVNHEAALLYIQARQYGEQQSAHDEIIRGELRRRIIARMEQERPLRCSRCGDPKDSHNVACFECECVGFEP